MSRNRIRYLPIDEDRLQRFHHDAPRALVRRSTGFVAEQWMNSAELLLVGLVGLVGLLWLDWSAEGALACLLVGVWSRVLGDLMKYLLVRPVVRRWAEEWNQDVQTWAVASALMRGDPKLRDDGGARYLPGVGLLIDLVLCGLATAVIAQLSGLARIEVWQGLLDDAGWRWTLIALVAWQVLTALSTALRHALLAERAGPIGYTAGARGFGLLLLMFAVALIFEGDASSVDAARHVMLVANGLLLLVGVLMLIGSALIQRETRWLRDYLARR